MNYAYVSRDGTIHPDTVGSTMTKAYVNAIAIIFGKMVIQGATDEQVESAFNTLSIEQGGSIRPVIITVAPLN